MAGLTGKTVATTYHSLLKVSSTDNQNFDTTLRDIVDGEDTASCLKLATDKATVTLGADAGDDFLVTGSSASNALVVEGESGQVGIGTAAPGAGLEIKTSNSVEPIRIRNSSNSDRLLYKFAQNSNHARINMYDSSENLGIMFDAGTGISHFGGGSAAAMKVGIGLTDPGYPLEVTSTALRTVNITNTTTSGVTYGTMTESTGGATTNIGLLTKASGATNNYGLIVSGGNVGIGTTAPESLLEVRGVKVIDATCDYEDDPTIAHDANILIVVGMMVTGTGIPEGSYVGVVSSSTSFELYKDGAEVSTTGGSVTNGTLTFANPGIITLSTSGVDIDDGDIFGRINFQAPLEDSAVDASLVGASIYAEAGEAFSSSNNSTALVFSTGTTSLPIERMRIDQDGNVGIGDIAPACMLEVGGAIAGKAIAFTTTGPTDNVDVSATTVLNCNTSSSNVTIGGFTGGVAGQMLHIIKTTSANNLILENNEGVNQHIYLCTGADETIVTYGGWTLVCNGSHWFATSSPTGAADA